MSKFYNSINQSRLYKLLQNDQKLLLNNIWEKAQQYYNTINGAWRDWIGHDSMHALHVLSYLEQLIPESVFKDIGKHKDEVFILITGALLHDIGMAEACNEKKKQEDESPEQFLYRIRKQHGKKGVNLIKGEFREIPHDLREPICTIIENHHGEFKFDQNAKFPYLNADALWVRFADELDFGPDRAPTFIYDFICPCGISKEHWLMHIQLEPPIIDLTLKRIQVKGSLGNDWFIKKLREEFEKPDYIDTQERFLGRGGSSTGAFIVQDRTTSPVDLSYDKENDPRPSLLTNDYYFMAGRAMYNLALYEYAKSHFEEGFNRTSTSWYDEPACYYCYHYLKTRHALGEHDEAIKESQELLKNKNIQETVNASLLACNGLGYWKLGNFTGAITNLTKAEQKYKRLAASNIKHLVDQSDVMALMGNVYLEEIRKNVNNDCSELYTVITEIESIHRDRNIDVSTKPESHYEGRFGGLMAFCKLLEIERKEDRKKECWFDAIDLSQKAFGGDAHKDRNPMGILSGKYCAAAVHLHKSKYCNDTKAQIDALTESERHFRNVVDSYIKIYGPDKKIYRTCSKICKMYKELLHQAQTLGIDNIKNTLLDYSSSFLKGEPEADVEIFTPIH